MVISASPVSGDPPISDDPPTTVALPWHRAATLRERQAAGAPSGWDRARGERRLTMWTELVPFRGDPDTIDERLAPVGVTADELVTLLGETDDSLAARLAEEPTWHRRFVRWWRAAGEVPADRRLVGEDLDLLEVARPLLEGAAQELFAAAHERLHRVGPQLPAFSDVPAVVDRLLGSIPAAELHGHVSRTMVLELNVARLEDRLDGETPQQRYASFLSLLGDPRQALAMWQEYPVLARLLVERLGFWIDTRLELLEALINDLPDLVAEGLLPGQPTRLEKLGFGAGDSHRRGRTVVIVSFDCGQVVYKPRPMVMDTAFDGLLEWVNNQPLPHQQRRIKILDRGDYGWTEFVDTSVTTDEQGGDRYAWRLGSLTALLYLLHATDFHFENALAAGEYPVLVDLEALLHCDKTAAVVKVDGVPEIAATTLLNSVQSVGVLPNRMLVRSDEGTFDLDLSAMAGKTGQLSPTPVPDWEDPSTDAMRLVSRHRRMEDTLHNHPTGADGKALDLVERAELFVAGFCDTYRALRTGRDELLAPGGPVEAFGAARSRLIARPTHVYGRLLMESTHPDFLRNALDRERSFARLGSGHEDMACRHEMIQDERAELWQGDVPTFTIDAESGQVRAGLTGEVIGHSAWRPLAEVVARLRQLGDQDLAFQEWVIRSSIATTIMGGEDARWPNWRRPRRESPAGPDAFADEALRVGRRLAELSVSDEHAVGWVGLSLVDEKYWKLTPASTGTYVGTGGIGLALDAVAAVTGDAALDALAGRVFDELARRATMVATRLGETPRKKAEPDMGIGAFSDLGGIVYALAHAAVRRDRPDYAESALKLLPSMGTLADEDMLLDVVSGAAGAILTALSLERALPGRGALDLAERCARRLLATRRPEGGGWLTRMSPEVPLGGLSHGAGGMALALARLHLLRPDPAYLDAVREALRYEASTYDENLGNWRDLRPLNQGGKSVMTAWCHGAPGVALVRHELLATGLLPDLAGELDADRHRGVLTTMATGLDQDPVTGLGNHSLCHGDVGNLLIVQKVLRPDREPAVAESLPRVWHTLLIEGRLNRWLCGVPHGIETPGLMVGIAGIAWGLARMAAPEQVPDILAVAPPARSVSVAGSGGDARA